ncbi:MAG: DNA double-strand break repair nuclease NurA [Anaerolineales bacterium]
MLDFQQVRTQIQEMGQSAPLREEKLRLLRERANDLLDENAQCLDALRAKVQLAAQEIPTLRCARPAQEALNAHLSVPALDPQAVVTIAADGSQINPDRHAPVAYYLVNVGALCLPAHSTAAPTTWIQSRLAYGDEMYPGGRPISEGAVALLRDVAERKALSDLVAAQRMKAGAHVPIVTLTDGPLELWGAKGQEETSGGGFRQALQSYLDALQALYTLNAVTAGYVDKPRADLVIRLLEIASTPAERLRDVAHERHFPGVSDWALFAHRLQPGERSAVFGLQSQSEQDYTANLGLHFFYLNVGRAGKPWLARVEIPRWVAETPAFLDHLHAVLVHQAHLLGERAYPYLLHRAHEVAVVSREEQEQLTNMIILELRRQGVEIEGASHKQDIKDVARRA